MAKEKAPVTPAVRMLRAKKINFTNHLYKYEEHGGAADAARKLGLDEHSVIKTLIMEDEKKNPLIVLMHGDMEVSTKELARQIGVKAVSPCAPQTAQKYSGYMVGGTSPFGVRKAMPVYMEETVLELTKIYINGGKRGYLIGMESSDLVRVLQPALVRVGI